MAQGFETVLDEITPPEGLRARVFSALAFARRRRARVQLALQSLLCFASGLALVPLAQYAGAELYASGFYDYLSLFFVDRGAVFASWQEFLYTLMESLPSIALLLIVGAGAVLLWSLRRAVANSKAAFAPLQPLA